MTKPIIFPATFTKHYPYLPELYYCDVIFYETTGLTIKNL